MGNNEENKKLAESSKNVSEDKDTKLGADVKDKKDLKAADKIHKKKIKSARPNSKNMKKMDLNDLVKESVIAQDKEQANESNLSKETTVTSMNTAEGENAGEVSEKETQQEVTETQEQKDISAETQLEEKTEEVIEAEEITEAEKTEKEEKEATPEVKPNVVPQTEDRTDILKEEVSEYNQNEPQEKKKRKGLKVFGIVLGMTAVLAAGIYSGISYYYTDKFIEGTSVNGIDCAGKTAAEVEKEIADKVENYSITVYARDQKPELISGEDIGYQYLSNGDILRLLTNQKPYLWIEGYFKKSKLTAEENIVFDHELLQKKMGQLECAKEENQVAPEDAYISYTDSVFEIVPETQGASLLTKKAYQELEKAVTASSTDIDFESLGLYETATVKKDDPKLTQAVEVYNKYSKAKITLVIGDQKEVLDASIIKDWLSTSSDGMLYKDDAAFREYIADYVATLGRKYDTVGTGRTFTATTGRTVTVYGYAYGWEIDEAAEVEKIAEEIENGEKVEREPIWSMTANSHDDSDVGDTYIEVDMGIQQMYYYMDGELVFESPFISGLPDGKRDTPEGIYLLYNKESPSVLRGEIMENGKREYETKVSYWMPFNGGIGFHDATWQYYGFGGDLYKTLGSHGCINLPLDAAAQLYSIIRYGDPIVCFY